jgi:glycosyltransferase involved in cell wall biosynthesis
MLDVTDAGDATLRGWGRYVAELSSALLDAAGAGLQIERVARSGWGPEFVWEQLGLPRRARRGRADVVHAPNVFLPLWRPCPGVVTVHDLAFERFPEDFARLTGLKYRTLAPRTLRSAERVICVSQFTADDVASRYGVAADRLRVIGLAPALRARASGGSEAAAPAAAPYLLGVGDLRLKKDFMTLVRAWLALRRDGFEQRLVLAGGDGGEGARLRAAAGGEPLELTGYVDDARLDALMRGADALVHPSRYEGFGLVLLEAMARDTPVVAANATALPETAGDAAAYFDPGDVDGLAATLAALLRDGAARDRLVERGRARVAGCSWEQTAVQTAAVYRELLT